MKQKFVNLFLVVISTFFLTSCITAALAGLVGGGSYYAGKAMSARDDRKLQTESLVKATEDLEKKQKQLTAQDTGITNEINGRLVSGSVAPNMAVYPEVRNGVVILHGRVPDPQTAEKVISTARSTPGVQRIISNLVVVSQQPAMVPQQMQGVMPQPMVSGSSAAPPNMNQQMMQQMPRQISPMPMQQQQYIPQMQQQQYIPPQTNNRNIPNISETASKKSGGSKKKSPDLSLVEKEKRPANQAKTMSPEMMEQYMDNDSNYVKYIERTITPPSYSQPAPVVSNPYIINVQTPTAYMDNDATYTPFTGYHRPATSTYDAGGNLNVNAPVPAAYQDNDANYELFHFY